MIRRAASEDVRRIPKKLRKTSTLCKQHSYKKARKKPGLIKLHYFLRQKKNSWLETHIWHAKRFHMSKLYGCTIPFKPTDKYYRLAIKNSYNGSTIQDVSYISCLEITGSYKILLSKLVHVFNPSTIFPKYESVLFELKTILYEKDTYPCKAIGPIKLSLIPYNCEPFDNYSVSDIADLCKILIWVHPAIYDLALKNLYTLFQLQLTKNNSILESYITQALKIRLNIQPKLNETPENEKISNFHSSLFVLNDVLTYSNRDIFSQDTCLTICSLKNNFVRFKLTGPLALRIICESLRPAYPKILSSLKDDKKDNFWWNKYYQSEEKLAALKSESTVWKILRWISIKCSMNQKLIHKIFDFDTLSPFLDKENCKNIIIPLIVRDPRLFRSPIKRTAFYYTKKDRIIANQKNKKIKLPPKSSLTEIKVRTEVSNKADEFKRQLYETLKFSAFLSPFWKKEVRDSVSLTKLPDHVLNKLRHKRKLKELNKIPASILKCEAYIPILLIYNSIKSDTSNPKTTKRSYNIGSGWDIIVPQNWGMPFWLTLVYGGALPIGLNEELAINLESRLFRFSTFPQCFPDTTSGRSLEESQKRMLQLKQERRPPAKRVLYNYTANGCKYIAESPYKPAWRALIRDSAKFTLKTFFASSPGDSNIKGEHVRRKYFTSLVHPNIWVIRDQSLLVSLKNALKTCILHDPVPLLNHLKPKIILCLQDEVSFPLNLKSSSKTDVNDSLNLLRIIFTNCHNNDHISGGLLKSALIPVEVLPVSKGTLKYRMPIYLKLKDSKDFKMIPPDFPDLYKPDGSGYYCIGFLVESSYSYVRGSPSGIGFISLAAVVAFLFICYTYQNDLDSGLFIQAYVKSRSSVSGYKPINMSIYEYS